jgi:two-component system, cell cycle sensor histidine kinase and response regulator CckA
MFFNQVSALLSWTDFSANLPKLDQIFDRDPLTLNQQFLVTDAIAQMVHTCEHHCGLDASSTKSSSALRRSCCVLVVEGLRPIGILTERDVVRLSIAGIDLSQMIIAQAMTQPLITLTWSPSQTIYSALALFQQHQIRHLPVVDDQGQLLGIVTRDRICQLLQPANLLKLRQVAELMSEHVIHATPTASILSIAQQMMTHRKSCVVVVEPLATQPQTLMPIGIITERDIVQFQTLGINFAETEAQAVMSTPLCCLKPTDSLWLAQQEMQRRRVRRLVVAGEQGEVRGILTQTSLLRVFDSVEMAAVIEVMQQQLALQAQALVQTHQQLEQEAVERQQVNTALQESQQQLQAMYEELEQQVATRTAELSQSNQDLRQNLEALRIAEEELRQQNEALIIARDAVEQQRQRYQELFEFAPGGYLVTDAKGIIREANGVAATLLCEHQTHLVGKPLFVFIAVPDRQAMRQRLTQPDSQWTCEVVLHPDTGESFPAELTAAAVLTPMGERVGWRWFLQDIRERVRVEADRNRAEAAQRDSEARLQRVASNVPGMIYQYVLRADGSDAFTYVSPRCRDIYELEPEVLLQDFGQIWAMIHPEDVERVRQVNLTSAQRLDRFDIEFRLLPPSGNQRWVRIISQPERQANGDVLWDGLVLDISETKQLEAQFLRAQRLESIGTLASGIAHDLNNILTPILTAAQLLLRKFPDIDESTQRLLEILEINAKRGGDLVKQVLAFARGNDGQHTTVQIGHLLAEIGQIAQQTFPKSIEVRTQGSPSELWLIRADVTQLHQAIMNLCVNARDAMPNGGTLTIAAENCEIDDTSARMRFDAQVGAYVKITISDTGTGIAPDVLDRIFDPFFTTKEQGQGTGLGLSTVRTIVKNHGGFIDINTRVGQGTRVQIYLPVLCQGEARSMSAKRNSAGTASVADREGNGELILVVDDEVEIGQTIKAMLEAHHYQVLVAEDGIAAIALYAQHQQDIHLVLLDLMMPAFDGFKLIATLPKLNPQVNIIAMSGLAAHEEKIASSDSLREAPKDRVHAFLAKPFTTHDLLTIIAQVLDRSIPHL